MEFLGFLLLRHPIPVRSTTYEVEVPHYEDLQISGKRSGSDPGPAREEKFEMTRLTILLQVVGADRSVRTVATGGGTTPGDPCLDRRDRYHPVVSVPFLNSAARKFNAASSRPGARSSAVQIERLPGCPWRLVAASRWGLGASGAQKRPAVRCRERPVEPVPAGR